MKPNNYRLVEVLWDDAESSTERWASLIEVTKDEPTLCISVGWLIKETDTKLHLAASLVLGDSDQVSGHVSVPKLMVKQIRELSVKKVRKPKQQYKEKAQEQLDKE